MYETKDATINQQIDNPNPYLYTTNQLNKSSITVYHKASDQK